MPVVAITREVGSLGTFIGRDVAERLGYAFVREGITQEAAREYRVLEERLVEAVEERPGLLEVVTHSARRYQAFVAAEVLDAALGGRVVLIGRWSAFLLQGVRHAIRVRVCAPLETRVARLRDRLRLDREAALRRIRETDEGVSARIRQVFDAEWRDPLLYDLTLNTGRTTQATGVEEILALTRAPEFQPTEDSRRALADLALAARVQAALKAEPATMRVDLGARADGGQVRLAGVVFRDTELEDAVRVARGVTGVTAVDAGGVSVVRMPVR